MSLKPAYFKYLEHFGRTVTLAEMARSPQDANLIGLRHDIDHDLDLALEVAHHEHARGIRATYYLLHTHAYMADPQLDAKCRQLHAYGHEVGLHLNALTQWTEGASASIDELIGQALRRLRASGVPVTGVSAHGDKACYAHGFINSWVFKELRGTDPAAGEAGKSAEGIVVDDAKWQVPYPADHRIRRKDGAALELWQSSLEKHGLAYEALHVPHEHYWTDTGGTWSRRGDPLQADFRTGRHQVLMHPFWWRGAARQYFVMSASRSGSTWLANFVNRATSCRGLHEWTFNHARVGNTFVPDHRTTVDLQGLVEDAAAVATAVRNTEAHSRILKRDVLEANVYFGVFAEAVRASNLQATFIHLHRDPRDVIRSLLNRDWYDSPADRRHVAVPVPEWDGFTQAERAASYVAWINQQIGNVTDERLCFERMVSDLDYLTHRLTDLGIVVHPLLAQEEFPKRINAGDLSRIPRFDQWPDRLQRDVLAIVGEMGRRLGYPMPETADDAAHEHAGGERQVHAPAPGKTAWKLGKIQRRHSAHNLKCSPSWRGLAMQPGAAAQSPGHVVLARGAWRRVDAGAGVPCAPNTYFTGEAQLMGDGAIRPRLFVLYYGRDGQQVGQRHVATWRLPADASGGDMGVEFSFVPPAGATHWALAVQLDSWGEVKDLLLTRAEVNQHVFAPGYRVEDCLASSELRRPAAMNAT